MTTSSNNSEPLESQVETFSKEAAANKQSILENEDGLLARQIQESLQKHFPLESKDQTVKLELLSVRVNPDKDPIDQPGEIARRRYSGRSYELPIMGKFRMTKKGKVVDEREIRIGPYYPVIKSLGTRLVDGKLYQNKLQVRRLPGIYAFKNEGGSSILEFNTAAGKSFDVGIDTKSLDSQTLDLLPKQGSPVVRGAYALSRAMGATDKELQEAWGEKIWEQNANVWDAKSDAYRPMTEAEEVKLIDSTYGAMKDRYAEEQKSTTPEEAYTRLKDRMGELDGAFNPNVNKYTIGHISTGYDKKVFINAGKKLVDIYTGAKEPEHRFAERFRRIHGVPTQIRAALDHKSFKGSFLPVIQRQIDAIAAGTADPTILEAVRSGRVRLSKTIAAGFTMSELTNATETNNILDIDSRAKEVTIKGPGGIRNQHTIKGETVSMHPGRLGLLDIVKTQVAEPGMTFPLASSARVIGDEVKRLAFDRKLGVVRTVSNEEIDEGHIAFPDEFVRSTKGKSVTFTPKKKLIRAAVGDYVKEVAESSVRYVLMDATHMFSDATNTVPFINHDTGARAIMGVNQMTQALSLAEPEAPLVAAIDENGETFERRIGRRYNVEAQISGTVSLVSKDFIEIKSAGGTKIKHSVLRDVPLNQGAFIDQTPIVKSGDVVKEGDLLTRNNYTDDTGEMAIGRNVHCAYMPFEGHNYEDGLVMSESGAKKFTSRHIIEFTAEIEKHENTKAATYNARFRARGKQISQENLNKLDADGVIKKGSTVTTGELLVPITSIANLKDDKSVTEQLNKLFKKSALNDRDRSMYWDDRFEGEVVEVTKDFTPDKKLSGVRIFIKVSKPFREGDKLSGRHGEKGIVGRIMKDSEMPSIRNPETGKLEPVDLLIDPHGVPSRANPGQLLELAAGKIAKKTGKRYLVKNFEDNALERVKADLKKAGLADKDDLIDPRTGKTIPQVATGWAYKAKLRHQLDKKFSVRDTFASGYDLEGQPVGGQSVDNLTMHALVGHNARANLSEMARLKGTNNQSYWEDLARGITPPRPNKTPHSFDKLRAMIESLGVNVEKRGELLKVTPMTDREVMRRSQGAMTKIDVYEGKKDGLEPIRAGLFDPKLVGAGGKNWNHINLPEPVPNPLFKKPVSLLLEMGAGTLKGTSVEIQKKGKWAAMSTFAQVDIDNVYMGKTLMRVNGKEMSGGKALQEALKTVDLEVTAKDAEGKLKIALSKGKMDGSKANNLHMTLRYARSLKESDIRPEEGYLMTKVPVMPAQFRQPIEGSSGRLEVPSVNHLYRFLVSDSQGLEDALERGYTDDMEQLQVKRARLLQSFGALLGSSGARPTGNVQAQSISDAIASPKTLAATGQFDFQDTDAKGPKGGYSQRRVVRKKMEVSGASTIIPAGTTPIIASMDGSVDEVGVPEEMAWKMYEPFIMNRMARERSSAIATKEVRGRTPTAREYLKQEMLRRPVLLNRHPSWWKFNVMAFRPKLIEASGDSPAEKALRVPNLVVQPYFGGDYDGDRMSVHVPAEEEAVAEAWTMLPSLHLRAPGTKSLMMLPNQSMLLGLNMATDWNEGSRVRPSSDPIAEYQKGTLKVDEVVSYRGRKTTAGWEMIEKALYDGTGGKLTVDIMLKEIEKERGDRRIKGIGTGRLMRPGFSMNKKSIEFFGDWLSRTYTKEFAAVIARLSTLGDKVSTEGGFSIGISDLVPFTKETDKIMAQGHKMIPLVAAQMALKDGGKALDYMDRASSAMFGSEGQLKIGPNKFTTTALDQMNKVIENTPALRPDGSVNALLKMMEVGSKGNVTQVRQILGAPMAVNDVMKRTIPIPIHNSYAQGLTTSEYWIQQNGSLSGLRDRSKETSKPGDLGKQIVASSSSLVVTEKDCGTLDGVTIQVRNVSDLLGRYLALPAGPYKAGQLLEAQEVGRLANARIMSVVVRSPLECESEHGVCSLCAGTGENGRPYNIGRNVGIEQGQAIVQKTTNETLKSFHTNSAAGQGTSFERIEEIVHLKAPIWKAVMVKVPDEPISAMFRITQVEEHKVRGKVAGRVITLRSEKDGSTHDFRIPPGVKLLPGVKEKTLRLKNGDKLTEGNLDPNDILQIGTVEEGVRNTQTYVRNELQDIFKVPSLTTETIVASMSSKAQIIDPGDTLLSPGDFVRPGAVKRFNRTLQAPIVIDQAIGLPLAENVLTFRIGHVLTRQDAEAIKAVRGRFALVKVQKRPASIRPEIHSVLTLPRLGDDWLPQLNFRHLKDQLVHAGSVGAASNIHGSNPVGAYMYGAEFDRGSGGWRY